MCQTQHSTNEVGKMGSTQCEPIRWHTPHYTSRCPNRKFQTGLREDPESRLYTHHKRAVATGDVQMSTPPIGCRQATTWTVGWHMWWTNETVGERGRSRRAYIRTRKTYNLDSGSSLSPVWNSLTGHWEVSCGVCHLIGPLHWLNVVYDTCMPHWPIISHCMSIYISCCFLFPVPYIPGEAHDGRNVALKCYDLLTEPEPK